MSNPSILLFDGVCNFCNSTVIFILKRDKKRRFLFCPLQSDTGRKILTDHKIPYLEEPETAILIKNGKVYKKSDASIEVLRSLGSIYSMAAILKIFPRFIRDAVYEFISTNRYKWFGKKDNCMIPGPEIRSRFLG